VASLNARLAAARGTVYEERKLRAELEETARFAQEVLAIVGHDLRNPLAVIVTWSEALLHQDRDEDLLARGLNRIGNSATRATRLVGDLLDYSQARLGGGIPVVRSPVDVAGLIARVVDDLEITHPDRPIRVDAPVVEAWWDGDRIVQVLVNLLGNAVNHSPGDSPIDVVARRNGESVAISISNANRDGAVSAELLPHLFEPFRRGAVHTTARSKGVGLGLYIVKQIVAGHGGTVAIDSIPERTTFTVVLPRR
jgi:sigma-B regulation protein RsbU (phosphoserine phosphatase)